MTYIINWYTNPSFESYLNNITALPGTEIIRDTINPFSGSHSLHVITDGSVAGQGVEMSPTALAATTGAITFMVSAFEPVTLKCQAVSVMNGVLQTQTITATVEWTRVVFENLKFPSGDGIYAIVQTSSKKACEFYVDAIQVETSATAHQYIDGDMTGVTWTGENQNSASVMTAEYGTAAKGSVNAGGYATMIQQGEIFTTSAKGESEFGGEATPVPMYPVGAFTDFGIFELTDPDPAQTYVSWNNAGTSSSASGYSRVYGIFVPPLNYPNSTGANTWNRAAFAAVGFKWASVGAGLAQDFTDIQLEYIPVNTASAPVPSAYDTPRALHMIVHPDRLNYITNPSFEVSTANWSAVGSAVLSRDTTTAAPVLALSDEVQETAGTASMKVKVNAESDGASISVTNLIAGETYTISCYVLLDPGFADITLECAGAFGSVAGAGYPYGGTSTIGYGSGPYGGSYSAGTGSDYGTGNYGAGIYGGATPNDLPSGVWNRPSFQFTANDSAETFTITAVTSDDVVYPTYFWVDGVMCEAGSLVGDYFDGNFGTDYYWEGGIPGPAASPGLSRSYLYNQYMAKSQAVLSTLRKHIPLGLNYSPPIYTQPFSQ